MIFTVFALLVFIPMVSAVSQGVDLNDDAHLFLRERERDLPPKAGLPEVRGPSRMKGRRRIISC